MKYPEFETLYHKHLEEREEGRLDLLQHIMKRSAFLNRDENTWMKSVIEIVRKTSIYFQPQIRTKIMNEGWASYWHEKLFLDDDRIRGHEVDFARVHSGVTSLARVGLNPYALGMRIFQQVEESAERGKYAFAFQRILDAGQRDDYDDATGKGIEYLFHVREHFSDFMFVNTFVDQDFVNRHKLFVVGKRLNQEKMAWEYFVKSRKAVDYREMIVDMLYHPPHVSIDLERSDNRTLYLVHRFEGKPLVRDFIPNTMLGIEFLWGGEVLLETSEIVPGPSPENGVEKRPPLAWRRVLYAMANRKLEKRDLEGAGQETMVQSDE
jgi:stage V sporulation protein R